MSDPLATHVKTLQALKDKNKEESEGELRSLLAETDYIEIMTNGSEEDIDNYIQELFTHSHKENLPYYRHAANSGVEFAESVI